MKNTINKRVTIKKLYGILIIILPAFFISSLAFFSIFFDSHPSSTSAIGYFFLPIIFVFGLVAGFILKLLVIYLLVRFKPETSFRSVPMRHAVVYTLILCITSISIAALIANRNIDSYNKKN